jgi:hypothetical protein
VLLTSPRTTHNKLMHGPSTLGCLGPLSALLPAAPLFSLPRAHRVAHVTLAPLAHITSPAASLPSRIVSRRHSSLVASAPAHGRAGGPLAAFPSPPRARHSLCLCAMPPVTPLLAAASPSRPASTAATGASPSAAIKPVSPGAKVAFVFPGQGSQEVGMTKAELAIPAVKALYDKAQEILGYDLRNVSVRVSSV